MKNKLSILFIVLICALSLSGCWDKRELDEIALVSGLAVDLSEKGYLVSLQVMVAKEIASEVNGVASSVRLFADEGESLFQVIRKLTKTLPRKGYFTHLMAVIIHEDIEKERLLEVLDFLLRDPEIRPDVEIFIAKDVMARDVLKSLTHIETIPANKIRKAAKNTARNWTGIRDITIMNLVNSIASDGVNPALHGVTVVGEKKLGEKVENIQDIDSPTLIELVEYAVYKDNQIVGWLNEYESRGYAYLVGEINNTIITIPGYINNTTLNLEVTKFKNKTEIKVKDGKPKVKITHKMYANIGQTGCVLDLCEVDKLDEFAKLFEKAVIENSRYTLNKLQKEYKSDIIGFGDMIHKKEPKLWKKYKQDWDSYFEELEVEIDCKIKINRPGIVRSRTLKEILKK